MLPVNLLMLSELKLVNVFESLRCLFACFTSSAGRLGSNNVGGCCKVCNLFVLQASFFVSWCLHVAGFPVLGGIRNVLFSGWLSAAAVTSHSNISQGALGWWSDWHFSSVFHEVPDGTISRFSLATRCSWCSAGVLEGSVTWSHLSVSPPFVVLFVPCAAGMWRGHGCSLWPQGVHRLLAE